MPIIATAGHVDHGKSTLVLALTGRDPDRLAEEKRRGLTIDLGFAWTDIEGIEVGFVDVPGHERFIKNMLAGVGAVDVALLVVAADEGWMPQTEEHAAVLDLLEVRHGVIALSRADLVDAELIELAELEVADHVAGTALEGWPIIPVAAPQGLGMEALRAALAEAIRLAGPPPDRGRPRLWVDRAFSISGAGLVVTGTTSGGTFHVGDEVIVFPAEAKARIRGIQSHERALEHIGPGNRTALNLAGIDPAAATRGSMVGRPEQWAPSPRILADVRVVRGHDDPLTDRGAYHAHLGSDATPVRLRVVDWEGERGVVVLTADRPLPVTMGDRLILREVGRRAVIAGGRVLDPSPPQRRQDMAAASSMLRDALGAAPDVQASRLLAVRRRDRWARLAAHAGGGTPQGAIDAGHLALDPEEAAAIERRLHEVLSRFQEENPLRPGMPKASAASAIGEEPEIIESVVAAGESIVDEGATLRTADFTSRWGEAEEAAFEAATAALRAEGLGVPRASQLGLDAETLHAALRAGKLVRVAEDLVFLPEQVEEIERRLRAIGRPFTVAEARDVLGVSRRHAVPLLEWLDQRGVTRRRGDVRTTNPSPPGQRADGAPPR